MSKIENHNKINIDRNLNVKNEAKKGLSLAFSEKVVLRLVVIVKELIQISHIDSKTLSNYC